MLFASLQVQTSRGKSKNETKDANIRLRSEWYKKYRMQKKTKFKMFQLYFWTCSAWVGSPTQSITILCRLHSKHALESTISYHIELADTNVWIFGSPSIKAKTNAKNCACFIISLPSTPTCLFILEAQHMQTCSCGIFKVPTFLFQAQNLCMSVLGF